MEWCLFSLCLCSLHFVLCSSTSSASLINWTSVLRWTFRMTILKARRLLSILVCMIISCFFFEVTDKLSKWIGWKSVVYNRILSKDLSLYYLRRKVFSCFAVIVIVNVYERWSMWNITSAGDETRQCKIYNFPRTPDNGHTTSKPSDRLRKR